MTAAAIRSPTPGRRTAGATSWLPVGLALFLVGWGGNQFTPLLVMYRERVGFSTAAVDLLLGAYVLGIAPGMLVGGPLSDRFGRRPLMLAAPPLAVAASVLLALDPHALALLFAGRVLAGLALGVGMAVGSTWISELSRARGEAGGGAARATLALTTGFLVGPAAAGLLAQWGPAPEVLPYVLHAAVALPLGLLQARTAETLVGPGRRSGRLRDDLRVPVRGHRRFWTVVAPAAPWVFTSAGVAYAVLPSLVSARVPGHGIAFATAMTAITLLTGTAAQSVSRRSGLAGVPGTVTGLGFVVVGTLLAGLAADLLSLALAAVAAAVLGVGYGFVLVSGLGEVQRLSPPEHLAGLTALFYSLAYTGFLVPMLLAVLSAVASYPLLLGVGAALAVGCLAVVVAARRAPDPVGPLG